MAERNSDQIHVTASEGNKPAEPSLNESELDTGTKESSPHSEQQVLHPREDLDPRQTSSCLDLPRNDEENSESAILQETLKSFVKAVHEKYSDNDTGITEVAGSVVFVPRSGPVKVTASGSIVLPRQVSMSGCEISVAGDPALIEKMCQRVKELDIMENNITSWAEVFCILKCIPHMTFLNLTKNQLTSEFPDLSEATLPSLNHLVLNNTNISWKVLLKLLKLFPSIEELHFSLNGFETVDLPACTSTTPESLSTSEAQLTTYPALRKFFFVGNKVTDWKEINKLGKFFPNLEFLLLSETELNSFDDLEELPECFPCLKTLGLNRTNFDSWQEIEKLRFFPSLNDVRLGGIPFLEAFPEKVRRQRTVAILPNIYTLNGSPVRDVEREEAERAYIRLYLDEEEKPDRYYELEERHGKLEPLVKIELKPRETINVTVRVEGPNGEHIKTEQMDIKVNQTIRELKKVLSNVAGRSSSKFYLYHLDKVLKAGETKINPSDRKVFSYNMHDGDELILVPTLS